MKLRELIYGIEKKSIYVPDGFENIEISSICHDSRRATGGCIFVCRNGSIVDGHDYAMSAYRSGARVFIVERKIDIPDDAMIITVESSFSALCYLSEKFYSYPAKKLRLVGITGTKGKTTLALSVYDVANKYGISTGYIGTNGIIFGGKTHESVNTTPDVLEIQKYLRLMVDAGIEMCVIEVSSQALWQDRIHGLSFETTVFTNLYHDHIGGAEHPTMEHYRDSKKRLFDSYESKNIVINSDSEVSAYMINDASPKSIITTSAGGNSSCDIWAENLRKTKKGVIPGVSFDVCFKNDTLGKNKKNIFFPHPALFSIENALQIVGVCISLGIDSKFVVNSLPTLTVSGRFEFITLESKPKSLFVIDYAHNGASLNFVLSSLREYARGKLIVLFGSVGGRTFTRRAELGRAAKDNADISIITSDNPNFEDPMSVIGDIAKEFEGSDIPPYQIPDRREAIKRAYELAGAGDIVLLAGKGHEKYQLICGERVPFSEREILLSLDGDAKFLSELEKYSI